MVIPAASALVVQLSGGGACPRCREDLMVDRRGSLVLGHWCIRCREFFPVR